MNMAQKVTEKGVLARLVSHCSKKPSSFMRRDKTADRQLERKNMASLSGCFLDWVPKKMQRVGCMELLNTVQRRVQPKFHVFGHIHEGYGMMTDGTTTFINASACTVNFMPMNAPIVFDLPNPRTST
ncbi:Metallophosphoesterase domain containing protein 1 [Dissostichus eleginoides]|uniref:Metallophosphoesterase domain containing protein 1 n=1 Tax=Dissostichus eleginoides TaxID=100907 RepID=A0AAD9FHM2_DISEL|nr:Metallophosphoesterase domain containing protein 1 [Dissostichus eleginoides]